MSVRTTEKPSLGVLLLTCGCWLAGHYRHQVEQSLEQSLEE